MPPPWADFAVASGRAILTPHAGELARLFGTGAQDLEVAGRLGEHDGLAFALERGDALLERGDVDTLARHELAVAESDTHALDRAFDPPVQVADNGHREGLGPRLHDRDRLLQLAHAFLAARVVQYQDQIRGGVGVFAGRTPFVWISNNYARNGIEQVAITATAGYLT